MRSRDDIEKELREAEIPGCSREPDEDMGEHIVHLFLFYHNSLVEAKLEIERLKEIEWMYKELCK